jgi:glyoxylase-like metal-dependent hydrolase (beta-lactamase superfamily II)
MQEIAKNIFIEKGYLGVTLGAVNMPHGLLLIDAPPRPEDVRSWRASLLNLGGGVDRLLVNLDAHVDRTLGVKAMECTVVAHEKTAQAFRNRPTAFKSQDVETGADWELCNGLGSIRWAPPEITFTQQMQINWDEFPILLEHHSGSHPGAIWVNVSSEKVCFVGDAVLPGQPPFLASADLPLWIESLKLLLSPLYQDYIIIGGRTGLVTRSQVKAQLEYLQLVQQRLEELSTQKVLPEDCEIVIPELMAGFSGGEQRIQQFTQRLKWGLYYYYSRHYRANAIDDHEE